METSDHQGAEVRAASVLFVSLALLVAALSCSSAPTQAARQREARPAAAAEPVAVLIAGLQSGDPIVQADAARLLGELRRARRSVPW